MSINNIFRYIDQNFPEHLKKTQEFLRIPSISVENVRLEEAAQWLKSYIEKLGGNVEMVGNEKAPVICARFNCHKSKTLLVYGMYDVQPVAGQRWSSPPFQAEIHNLPGIGDSIIARGACNSKGPLMGFLNALQAIIAVDHIPVDLLFTIEGEEEIGSPSLRDFYKKNKTLIQADAGFDPFWADYGTDVDQPIISLGSKGILNLELICRGGDWGGPTIHPVHSSVGAWLASPIWRLIKALNTFIGKDEQIKVDGFNKDFNPPSPEDEELLKKLSITFDEKRTLEIMGGQRFRYALHGTDLLRKYLFSPTIQVNFLSCNMSDVIPPEAKAELVIRIIPGMDPELSIESISRHLKECGYGDIEVLVKFYYPSSRTSLKESVVQSMIETYRDFGKEPQIWPLLASATPYYLFSEILGIPYVWGGLGKAGGSHAPDEFASVEGLRQFEKSIVTFLYRFARR